MFFVCLCTVYARSKDARCVERYRVHVPSRAYGSIVFFFGWNRRRVNTTKSQRTQRPSLRSTSSKILYILCTLHPIKCNPIWSPSRAHLPSTANRIASVSDGRDDWDPPDRWCRRARVHRVRPHGRRRSGAGTSGSSSLCSGPFPRGSRASGRWRTDKFRLPCLELPVGNCGLVLSEVGWLTKLTHVTCVLVCCQFVFSFYAYHRVWFSWVKRLFLQETNFYIS